MTSPKVTVQPMLLDNQLNRPEKKHMLFFLLGGKTIHVELMEPVSDDGQLASCGNVTSNLVHNKHKCEPQRQRHSNDKVGRSFFGRGRQISVAAVEIGRRVQGSAGCRKARTGQAELFEGQMWIFDLITKALSSCAEWLFLKRC